MARIRWSRVVGSVGILGLCGVAVPALDAARLQETVRQSAPAPSRKAAAPGVLSGCVSKTPGPTGDFTFTDAEAGSTYRVAAKRVRKFAGSRVELVLGSKSRGLVIRGGLLPSPNIAAQAGHIDPAQAAIASQPGGTAVAGTGTPAPRIDVTRVRALPGAACD